MYTREKMLEQQWRDPKNPIVRVRPPWGPHHHKMRWRLPGDRPAKAIRKMLRVMLRNATVTGYPCPRCFKRYPTPAERLTCRRSHHTIALAVKEAP